MASEVLLEGKGAVALLTINRPSAMNALNSAVIGSMTERLSELEKAEDVTCLIITGAGDKAFIAGADIKEMKGLSPIEGREHSLKGQELMNRIEAFPVPVIAAINGYCLGGGCELALACHLRIASSGSRLGQPEVGLGLIPGYGGTQRLSRLIGRSRALELILTGEPLDAADAEAIGLVNRVVDSDSLLETCYSLAERIGRNSPIAVRLALEAVLRGEQMSQAESMRFEAVLFGHCFASEDSEEGISAFVEKRKAKFKGK